MGASVPMSFRTDDRTAADLDRLVQATDRPRSWHLEQALQAYLKQQAWQVDDIRQGVAEADADDFADDAEIDAIFRSFGEPPEGRRR